MIHTPLIIFHKAEEKKGQLNLIFIGVLKLNLLLIFEHFHYAK